MVIIAIRFTSIIFTMLCSRLSFNTYVNITDAQYVYRELGDINKYPTYNGYPYFYYLIPEKVYVGRTGTGRQFNCACTEHQ